MTGRQVASIQLLHLVQILVYFNLEQPINGRFQPAPKGRLLNVYRDSAILNIHKMEVL
jgi:hypothetical protein